MAAQNPVSHPQSVVVVAVKHAEPNVESAHLVSETSASLPEAEVPESLVPLLSITPLSMDSTHTLPCSV